MRFLVGLGRGRRDVPMVEYWEKVLAEADLHRRGLNGGELEEVLESMSLQRLSSRVELAVTVDVWSDQYPQSLYSALLVFMAFLSSEEKAVCENEAALGCSVVDIIRTDLCND